MKKILFVLLLIVQYTINAQMYYDVDNNKIDKATFDKLLKEKGYDYVTNDSLKAFKVMKMDERSEIGSLGDVDALYNELNEKLNLKLDKNKPLIIYYYPGKDACNSSGTSTRKSQIQWYRELEKKIQKNGDVNVLYVFKSKDGIKTLDDHDWRKDPNALIENLFFNFHYWCGSFVVINKDKYAAYFGEYGHDNVLLNLAYLLKQ